MMRTFRIPRDPLDMGCKLYQKANFTFKPGLTVLVGCNGAGKSTLIQMVSQSLQKKKIPLLWWK